MATNPLVAEALVLRDAIIFASNLQLNKIVMESDNLQLVQAVRGEIEVRSISNLIQDILTLHSKFQGFGITWLAREGNHCAHLVADLHCHQSLPSGWIFRPPLALSVAQVLDRGRVFS